MNPLERSPSSRLSRGQRSRRRSLARAARSFFLRDGRASFGGARRGRGVNGLGTSRRARLPRGADGHGERCRFTRHGRLGVRRRCRERRGPDASRRGGRRARAIDHGQTLEQSLGQSEPERDQTRRETCSDPARARAKSRSLIITRRHRRDGRRALERTAHCREDGMRPRRAQRPEQRRVGIVDHDHGEPDLIGTTAARRQFILQHE
jgi:hypothetical protein